MEHFTRNTPEATAAGIERLAASDAAAPWFAARSTISRWKGCETQMTFWHRSWKSWCSVIMCGCPGRRSASWRSSAEASPRPAVDAESLVLTDGEERRGYLPAFIPTATAADESVKLGRLTDWIVPEGDGPVRGVGQHLLVAGEKDFGLLELRQFQAAGEV